MVLGYFYIYYIIEPFFLPRLDTLYTAPPDARGKAASDQNFLIIQQTD